MPRQGAFSDYPHFLEEIRKNNICCGYSLLEEVLLLSTHNICFREEIKKNTCISHFFLKNMPYLVPW